MRFSAANLRDIAEVAIVLAWCGQHQPVNMQSGESLTRLSWSHRLQCDLWTQCFLNPQASVKSQLIVAEEMLVCSLLYRIAAAVVLQQSSQANQQIFSRKVETFLSRVDRMSRQFFEGGRPHLESLANLPRLERLQRRLDRWSDLLLSPYANLNLNFQRYRCHEFWSNHEFSLQPQFSNFQLSAYSTALRLSIPNRELSDELRQALLNEQLLESMRLVPLHSVSSYGLRNAIERMRSHDR